MIILDIVYYSWLNKFFYTGEELVKSVLEMDKYTVIQLNLTIKEISYIKNNFENYIQILENVLFTYNQSWNKYFKNIAFNTIQRWDEIFNNCIFLYDSKNNEIWFQNTNSFIKIWTQKKEIVWKTISDKIIDLIYKKDLSVRNLIKLWIIQIRAREIYNFLKEKEVFSISEKNHNHKLYNSDNFKTISKETLNTIISSGV
jgi:hypothetical protein